MLSSVHLVPCMIDVARPMHASPSFFVLIFPNVELCILLHTACSSTLFSCAPKNLVSRDDFSSPVPRQLFFVPSEIGSTRVRAITSQAARLRSRACLRIWYRETVSAVPSRVSFSLYRLRSDRHGYERSIPGPHGFILVRV